MQCCKWEELAGLETWQTYLMLMLMLMTYCNLALILMKSVLTSSSPVLLPKQHLKCCGEIRGSAGTHPLTPPFMELGWLKRKADFGKPTMYRPQKNPEMICDERISTRGHSCYKK